MTLLLVVASVGLPGSALILLRSETLCKLAALTDLRAIVVEDPYRQAESEGKTEEDELRVANTEALVHFAGVKRAHTSEEVSRETVTTGGRRRVLSVGGDHVVDGGIVDGVVRHADEDREDNDSAPVEGRAGGNESTAEETDGKEAYLEKKPPEAALWGEYFALGTAVRVALDDGEEGEVGENIARREGNERQADLDWGKAPRGENDSVALEEGEDEGIGLEELVFVLEQFYGRRLLTKPLRRDKKRTMGSNMSI